VKPVIKTPADIERQKEDLLRRKPVLRDLRIVPLRESPMAGKTEDIAAFIDLCWADTYGNQDRFNYEADYLEWVFGDGGVDNDTSLAAMRGEDVMGIILGTPRKLLYCEKIHDTTICTGLSIHPLIKSEGLGRYIFLNVQEEAIRNLPCMFQWYHSSIANRFSSHQLHKVLEKDFFDHWYDYHLLSRIFDFNRVKNNARMYWYEQLGLWPFSGRKAPDEAMRIAEITAGTVDEVRHALNDEAKRQGAGRLFTSEELCRYACFQGTHGTFRSAGWFHRDRQGKIDSVAIGYPLETIGKNRDHVFFLDHLLPGPEKSSFIRSVEVQVYERFGVYGMITLDGRLGLREGYLPSRTILSCYSISFCEEIRKRDSRNRPFPIIDHK
jgi:hypothetical protein